MALNLDERIAKALGWRWEHDGCGNMCWLDREKRETGYGEGFDRKTWRPSTDLNQAWKLVEYTSLLFPCHEIQLSSMPNVVFAPPYRLAFYFNPPDNYHNVNGWGETPCLAICKACLILLENKTEDSKK